MDGGNPAAGVAEPRRGRDFRRTRSAARGSAAAAGSYSDRLLGCAAAAFLLFALAGPVRAGDPEPAAAPAHVAGPLGSRLSKDLEHSRIGERAVHLDLYRPAERMLPPYPTILWVHGGGWVGGNRAPCPLVTMTAAGYAVASVEYRLSSEAPFPAQIEDCKAAVRWVRANAGAYGLDADRIGAAGASAGGHLVALLGTAGDAKDLEGKGSNAGFSSRVIAVCDWFGPTDFLQFDGHGSTLVASAPGSVFEKLLGGPLAKKRALARKANPIPYVTKDDPPFLILHGDADKIVPLNQSELLHAALKEAGVASELYVQPGGGHGWSNPATNRAVAAFFERNLMRAKAAQAKEARPKEAPSPEAAEPPPEREPETEPAGR